MNKKQKKNIKVLSGVFVAAAGMIAAAAANASPVFAHPQSLHNGIFHTDFASFDELEEYAGELNAVMNEESIVLLKNKDNALPLAKGSTISLLGIHSYVPFAGGGGSGSGSGAKDTIPGSLRNFGFQLNRAVEQFYDSHRYSAQLATGMGQTNVNYDGPTSELDLVKDSFQLFGDTAVITLGRVGAEGGDLFRRNLPSQVAADPTRHILQLFDNEKELKIDSFAATAIYTGMITDTGRFKYGVTNSSPFIYAGKLMDDSSRRESRQENSGISVRIAEANSLMTQNRLQQIRIRR